MSNMSNMKQEKSYQQDYFTTRGLLIRDKPIYYKAWILLIIFVLQIVPPLRLYQQVINH